MDFEVKTGRSSNYVCTVKDRHSEVVAYIRQQIKESNKSKPKGKKEYVKLFARGPRHSYYPYYQNLPLKYGTSFDVYIYTRYDWSK